MKHLLNIFIFCFLYVSLQAQETYEYRIPIADFYATYDEGEDFVNIIEDNNGDFVVVQQYFIDSETQATALMKYGADGHVIWRKVLELDPDVIFSNVIGPEICTYEDRYAVIQNHVSYPEGYSDLYTIHTLSIFDEDGNVLEEHSRILNKTQQFTDVTPNNGGFVVASTNNNMLNIYTTDIDGFTIWEKQISLPNFETNDLLTLHEIISDENDNIYMFCSSESAHDGLVLIKLDEEGEIIYSKKYKDPTLVTWGYDPQCRAAINIEGDLYCFLTWQNNPGVAQYTNLYKFNPAGEVIFTKRIDELVFVSSISSSSDDGFTILFPNLNDQYGVGFGDSKDPALAKFDKNGNFDWGYIYGEEGDNFTDRHIVCDDRGYMMVAHTMEDYYIIKTDINGNTPCEIHPLTLNPIDFEVEEGTEAWELDTNPDTYEFSNTLIDQEIPELVDKCCLTNYISATFEYQITENLYEIVFINNTVNADTYAWDFGDNTNGAYQNPIHTFPGVGVYTVCLTAYNDCMQDDICVEITITEETIGVGLDEIHSIVSVFPNPANDVITIQTKKELASVVLRNQHGKMVTTTFVKGLETKMDLSKYNRGVYILELTYTNGNKTYHKIILQ